MNMGRSLQEIMTQFLRTYPSPFTAKDVVKLLANFKIRASVEEVTEFLDMDMRVFPLEKNFYLTHAGAFTGKFFSFLPTEEEVRQGVLVPGDRCMPFVDSEILSCAINFEYNGHILEDKIFHTTAIGAEDLFIFYGTEYASQYIAADPVNNGLRLAETDFELPPQVSLTGKSMERIFHDFDFHYGDRILCRVRDWDKGIVEIFPIVSRKKNRLEMSSGDFFRQKWKEELEKSLLLSFNRMGPCSCIEEQLANVFYEFSNTLCVENCSSIHEFIDSSKKVGLEYFGVETRLWYRGQDVPAVGEWNKNDYGNGSDCGIPIFALPEYVIDCCIKDQLFKQKLDVSSVMKTLLPKSMDVTPEERQVFALQIMHRNDILRKHYNYFADFSIGSLRHRALELYSAVGSLVYDVDLAGDDMEQFPQQELVTLSQLYTHISRILEMLSDSAHCEGEDTDAIQVSLEGMENNFEDIRMQLVWAVEAFREKQFKVI